MSYRTLKRILGETNFEVKCLVLFGFGLSVLAILTSWLYWWQTSSLIHDQNKTTAQLLMAPMIQQRHWEWAAVVLSAGDGPVQGAVIAPPNVARTGTDNKPVELQGKMGLLQQIETLSSEFQPEKLREFKFEMVGPDPTSAESSDRPRDDIGYKALEELRSGGSEFIHIDREKGEYSYYSPVNARESCLECHQHKFRKTYVGDEIVQVQVKVNDLIGMAKITLPLETVEESLHATNAFVMTSELVKVVLAILAIYLVVRYVITKPVLHLKRVSDAIAQGNLDMRADIRTGDEFEELSHAFNRMLRHLVAVQEELRGVNADLDGKVDELAHVNLKLYDMNNIKNEFLATMSHELRTPLNSILGFSDVLKDASNLTDRQKKYVGNIQTSGRSLMTLINDVLDLAKIESGKTELHPAEFQVTDLVERQVGSLAQMAERRNIALNWSVEPDLPILFQDPGKLQQVLTNLVSNAIKFTPEGGRVRVRAERRDNRVALIVEDNGIGIPLDEQERIFEKFRQGKGQPGQKDALTRKYEGTGLGLSIVKELSRLLGGEVTLESEFGKGSTFTVIIPFVLEHAESFDDEATSRLVGLNRFRTIDLPHRDRSQESSDVEPAQAEAASPAEDANEQPQAPEAVPGITIHRAD
jgi:two-component system, NarL family, sensor histidine kinase BarA